MNKETEKEQRSEIADEAFRISEYTNDDGTVSVQITDIRKKDSDSVTVEFRTPLGNKKRETMKWPEVEDSSYKIVQICENTVGSFAGIEEVKGCRVPASPDSWKIMIKSDTSTGILQHLLKVSLSFRSLALISILVIINLLIPILRFNLSLGLTLSAVIVNIYLILLWVNTLPRP